MVTGSRPLFSVEDLPLKWMDFGLISALAAAPLVMGGRGPAGKFVFMCLVVVAAVAWAVRQCRSETARWRWSGAEWLLLASLALVTLQLLPLPQGLLAFLSPNASHYLPLWNSESASIGLGPWQTISLNPSATRGALCVLVAYIMLFLLVVQRVESLEDVEWLLRWISVAVIGMALLGLAQLLVGNGKFLWLFQHPSRDTYRVVKGTFQNQNHFAHFLALGLGPLIWWCWTTPARSHLRQGLLVALGVVLLAGLLTFSRGGVVSLAIAGAVCGGIYCGKRLLSRRELVAAAVLGAVVLAALSIYGYGPLAEKLATLRDSRSLEEISHGRQALWSALCRGIPQFATAGTGVGTHRDVYPMLMKEYFSVEFTHGESGYLPLLLEAGIPGMLFMLTGIGLCLYWCVATVRAIPGDKPLSQRGDSPRRPSRPQRILACTGAILPGLVASVVHSVGDFVWYISGCMAVTIVLAACACRLFQLHAGSSSVERTELDGAARWPGRAHARLLRLTAERSSMLSRPAALISASVLVVVSASLLYVAHRPAMAAPHWYAYKRLSLANENSHLPPREHRELLFRMAGHLQRALAWDPADPRANLRLAGICLRRFDLEQQEARNPMALSQLRDAALASQFPSKAAQDAWLAIAIGENARLLDQALQHGHRGLHGCPLQGEGYVYLAELSFIQSPQLEVKDGYLAQAQRVRPHSGPVLFALGQDAALAGDVGRALEHWKQAFHQDPEIRKLIITNFTQRAPAAFLLETFSPETPALAMIFDHYRRQNQLEQARIAAAAYLEALQRDLQDPLVSDAATKWHRAQATHAFLGDLEQALACERKAIELDPSSVDKRRTLAALLAQTGQYAEAAEHFRWCIRRRPDDAGLAGQLAEVTRRNLEQKSSMRR